MRQIGQINGISRPIETFQHRELLLVRPQSSLRGQWKSGQKPEKRKTICKAFRKPEAPLELLGRVEAARNSELADKQWIGEEVEYNDGLTDIAFIAMCRY